MFIMVSSLVSMVSFGVANVVPATTQEEIFEKVIKWMLELSVDFMPIHKEVLSKRAADTGDWFFNHTTYLRWAEGEEKNLECTGIRTHLRCFFARLIPLYSTITTAGAGKSTIAYAFIYTPSFRPQI